MKQQIVYLTSLKVIFAVVVVLMHFCLIFLPTTLSADTAQLHLSGAWEMWLARSAVLYPTGTFTICGFFLLTGFFVGLRFFQQQGDSAAQHQTLLSSACKRYIRLTGPVLFSVLLAWGLLQCGAMQAKPLVNETAHSMPVFGQLYGFVPSLPQAVYEGLWGNVFDFSMDHSYNPVLWTMETDVKGAFLAMAFLALAGNLRRRWLVYVLLLLVSFKTFYMAVLLGVMLSDLLYARGTEWFREAWRRRAWLSWGALLLGICLIIYTCDGRNFSSHLLRGAFWQQHGLGGQSEVFFHIWGTALLVLAVCFLPRLQQFLSLQVFRCLGRYTFSIYLLHFPILSSLGCGLFWHSYTRGGSYGESCLLAFAASMLLLAVLTWLSERYIEQYFSRLAGVFREWMMR